MLSIHVFYDPERGERYAPVLCCDWCKKPITMASRALVKWKEDAKALSFAEVLAFHKGVCDEAHTKKAGNIFSWDELTHFLGRLINNLNEVEPQHSPRVVHHDLWTSLVLNYCPDEHLESVAKRVRDVLGNPENRPPSLGDLSF